MGGRLRRARAQPQRQQLAQSRQKDIFVFIHGYNTTFEGNTTVAAELRHYLGADSVFISYAWPSRGKLLAYGKDKASARDSTRSFRLFLQFLADNTDARKVHLIGHSAGAPSVSSSEVGCSVSNNRLRDNASSW